MKKIIRVLLLIILSVPAQAQQGAVDPSNPANQIIITAGKIPIQFIAPEHYQVNIITNKIEMGPRANPSKFFDQSLNQTKGYISITKQNRASFNSNDCSEFALDSELERGQEKIGNLIDLPIPNAIYASGLYYQNKNLAEKGRLVCIQADTSGQKKRILMNFKCSESEFEYSCKENFSQILRSVRIPITLSSDTVSHGPLGIKMTGLEKNWGSFINNQFILFKSEKSDGMIFLRKFISKGSYDLASAHEAFRQTSLRERPHAKLTEYNKSVMLPGNMESLTLELTTKNSSGFMIRERDFIFAHRDTYLDLCFMGIEKSWPNFKNSFKKVFETVEFIP